MVTTHETRGASLATAIVPIRPTATRNGCCSETHFILHPAGTERAEADFATTANNARLEVVRVEETIYSADRCSSGPGAKAVGFDPAVLLDGFPKHGGFTCLKTPFTVALKKSSYWE